MSAIDIINRLPFLWLVILYIGTPITFIFINFYNLANTSKNIKNAGEILYYFPKKEISRKSKAFCMIIITLSIFAYLFNKTIGFVFIIYSLSNLTWLISESTYFGKNGIYENGIVKNELIDWKSIFSWRTIGNKLELLNMDGKKTNM
jgi:hypothetical protein